MNMTQDTFNKLVTLAMLLYFMVMYAISFVTHKDLNFESLAGFLIPLVTHGSQLVYNTVSSKTSINAATSNVSPVQLAAMKEVVTGTPTPVSTNVVQNGVAS